MFHAIFRMLLPAMALVLAASSLFAVPPEVEKAFGEKHPGAEAAAWNLNSDGYWDAAFEENGVTFRADFTPAGRWVSTETTIEFEELPEKVQEAVQRDLKGAEITEIEAIDHSVHGKLYEIWIENLGKAEKNLYRENGEPFGAVLTLRDPQKRPELMEPAQLLREFGWNLLTILIFAWFIYYRRHHDHEMLFLLLGFNLFLFPIFLVSSNLSAGIGFTIFALLALVRLRSDTFSKTEMAYLLGAVALTFINAQLSPHAEAIGGAVVLITAWAGDHPRIWRDAYHTVAIRYKMKDTKSMLDQDVLQRRISREYQIEVTNLTISSVQDNEVRLTVLYRDLSAEAKARLKKAAKEEAPPA